MTNIREYEKKKESNANNDYNKIIIQHKLRVFYRVLLSALLAAAVLASLYISNLNKIYTEYQVVSSTKRTKIENAVSENLNGNILTYSNDGANCTDTKGNVLWNQTFEMQNPMVKINGKVAAIADYNGRTIYVVDDTGSMGEISTGMPIRTICVSQSGVVAAVLDDSEVNAIYIYNSTGGTIAYFKTTMKKSGYPISVAISGNSEIVAVSYLYLDSGTVTSNVAFYNFGPVGQNEVDNYVSGYSYSDAIVPEVGFLNNTTSFALADNRLVIYKGKQIPTSQAEVLLQDEVQSVYYNEDYIGLVYLNASGASKYKMDIYNDTGKAVMSKEFDLDYTNIFFRGDCAVVYNESECLISNMKGKEKFNGKFKTAVETLIPTSKISEFITITSDKIATIELK